MCVDGSFIISLQIDEEDMTNDVTKNGSAGWRVGSGGDIHIVRADNLVSVRVGPS